MFGCWDVGMLGCWDVWMFGCRVRNIIGPLDGLAHRYLQLCHTVPRSRFLSRQGIRLLPDTLAVF